MVIITSLKDKSQEYRNPSFMLLEREETWLFFWDFCSDFFQCIRYEILAGGWSQHIFCHVGLVIFGTIVRWALDNSAMPLKGKRWFLYKIMFNIFNL